MFLIGDTHRSISPIAIATRSGSSRSLRLSVGFTSSCCTPPLITWRVVSSFGCSRRSAIMRRAYFSY
jgi:hypothetical protein